MNKALIGFLIVLSFMSLGGCDNGEVQGGKNNKPLDYIAYHTQQGKLTEKSVLDTVSVCTDNVSEEQIHTDVYLMATINEKTTRYSLGNWDYRVLRNGNLILSDLNGDDLDEIVLIMEVTGNGSALAKIFSVQAGEISLLCDLNDLDTGLKTLYQNSFMMRLENPTVGFSKELDISKEFGAEHFDKDGKFTGDLDVFLNPIHAGTVKQSGEGKVPRIIIERRVALTNILGDLQAVFYYNSESEAFVLESVEFKTEDSSLS